MPEYPHDDLTEQIIGAGIEVHRQPGPGLLESAYETCLADELRERRIPHQRQVELPVRYNSAKLEVGYRLDLLVADKIIVELKAVDVLSSIHEAQLLT